MLSKSIMNKYTKSRLTRSSALKKQPKDVQFDSEELDSVTFWTCHSESTKSDDEERVDAEHIPGTDGFPGRVNSTFEPQFEQAKWMRKISSTNLGFNFLTLRKVK